MQRVIYLFYGFGSEYVLSSLYCDFTEKGYACIEIDALKIKNSKTLINELIGKKIVFITSAHILMDKYSFTDLYPNNNQFYGVLEIIQLLKPIKSIYIPHDLTQPLIRHEAAYLNQFDLFLSPCEPFTSIYSQYCKTEEVGWIKYKKNKRVIKKSHCHKTIWLLSDYVLHLQMGKEESYKRLKVVLDQGVCIKFPQWMGSREFEKYFSQQGVTVYPTSATTIDLIRNHTVIITNGLSSINAESYFLGKATVNIMEGSHYGEEKKYLEELFPELIFVEKYLDFDLSKTPSKEHPSQLIPFNQKKTLQLITKNI